MSISNDERQYEIKQCRVAARRLLNEAKWIRRQFYNLPFFKRFTALKGLLALETEARAALRKASSLKTKY